MTPAARTSLAAAKAKSARPQAAAFLAGTPAVTSPPDLAWVEVNGEPFVFISDFMRRFMLGGKEA